jgi:hypothetical protein
MALDNGNGLLYSTEHLTFPGGTTNNVLPKTIAMRGTEGWLSVSVDAPTTNDGPAIPPILQSVIAVSNDLTRVLVGSKRGLGPGGVDGNSNLYIYDVPTGQFTLVATTPDVKLSQDLTGVHGGVERLIGRTPDLSMVVFDTATTGLLPEAPAGSTNMYAWSSTSGLRLVAGGVADGADAFSHGHNQVSEDGSRIYFQDGAGSLMLSDDGVIRPVSGPGVHSFQGASPDGRYVTLLPNGGGKLSRWDAETDTTDVIATKVGRVLGTVPEKGIAYYTRFGGDVYYAHEGDETFIGSSGIEVITNFQTSPSGRYLVFDGIVQITSYDTHGQPELYLYDSQEDHLACVSCRSDHGPSMGPPHIGILSNGNSNQERHFPTSVTDTGQVFFDTPNALVPTDGNGNRDVYSYKDGHVALISPGTENVEAIFNEATPSGHDVYFATPQRLVGQDNDSTTDMYDARVEGGLRSQNPDRPVECLRDDCKATPGAGPELPFGGSEALSGPGNVKAHGAKRCGKGRHRVTTRGKSRCVKNHKRPRTQRVHGDRRQSR